MIEVTVSGGPEIRHVAALLREADATFDRQLVAGIRRAVNPIGPQIRSGVGTYMPTGYTPVLSSSLRIATSVRQARGAGVSIKVSAMGKSEQRDVRSLDTGLLKHPLFGNRARWYAQRIRPGFVTNPFQRLRGPVVREMQRVIAEVVNKIARG